MSFNNLLIEKKKLARKSSRLFYLHGDAHWSGKKNQFEFNFNKHRLKAALFKVIDVGFLKIEKKNQSIKK